MNCLPKINDAQFDATPDFWEESVIQELQIPRLIETSLERKRETAHSLDLQWATWIMCSRGFSTFKINQDGSLQRRTVLIPYLDMLNHDVSPNASIEVVECPGSYQDSFYALQALKSISAGEQITIGYGIRETSLDLLSKYGFWIPDNPADDFIDWNMVDPQWTTILEQDKAKLETTTDVTLRQVLLLRIHLKQLRSEQQ
jgi:SET domain